ncbi:MAG: AfsR/SARP family transcriptional regulator, partial [Acidimicrobiales bacterium]
MRVRILGPLKVEGIDPARLGSRKQRTLLRALALAGGAPVSVDRLIDCLWPDRFPAQPGEQVGVLVSRLRSGLGAHRVPRGDAGYSLAADWIDLVALEEIAAEAVGRLKGGHPAAAATAATAGL